MWKKVVAPSAPITDRGQVTDLLLYWITGQTDWPSPASDECESYVATDCVEQHGGSHVMRPLADIVSCQSKIDTLYCILVCYFAKFLSKKTFENSYSELTNWKHVPRRMSLYPRTAWQFPQANFHTAVLSIPIPSWQTNIIISIDDVSKTNHLSLSYITCYQSVISLKSLSFHIL